MKRIVLLCIFAPIVTFGQTLIELAEGNNLDGVILALRQGAYVNQTDEGGFTALHVASWNGYADVVRALLQAGANPNIPSKAGSTAIRFSTPEIKNMLVQYGAIDSEYNPTAPRLLYSPNIYVQKGENKPSVTIVSNIITNISNFIEYSTNITRNVRFYGYPKRSYDLLSNMSPEQSIALHNWDARGNNSIHQAAIAGNIERLKELIKLGMNPHSRNAQGVSLQSLLWPNTYVSVHYVAPLCALAFAQQ